MPLSQKLLKHLDGANVKYAIVPHRTVYTAYDLAQTMKRKLDSIAKAILVVADRNHCIVVLPGHRRIDLSKLKKALKAKKVEIAKETIQKKVLRIKAGALTPFGVLYKNTPVIVDRGVLAVKRLIVAGGSFEESIELSGKQLVKATAASVAAFSEAGKAVKKIVKRGRKKSLRK